ncbi:MAG: phosphate ABC transporter, partial [Spirochaetaceae bacterium]
MAQTQLTVLGATTIQPIIEAASEAFFAQTGIQVITQGGGSGRGVQAVLDGTADMGMVSRAISPQEEQLLQYRPIAADALAIIVDRGNPHENVSRAQLIELYRGLDRWAGIEGYTRRVILVNKEIGRATLDLFEDYTGLAHHERPTPGAAGSISAGAYDIGANSDS